MVVYKEKCRMLLESVSILDHELMGANTFSKNVYYVFEVPSVIRNAATFAGTTRER